MSKALANEIREENKMGVMPIGKLLFSMSVPMMISMLVQALYNIIDSIFVAQISEKALTAVSLANPIQMLMIAIGAGTGVGVNALLSRSLGEKNKEKANEVARNGIFLALMSYLVFLLVGLFVVKPFFYAQTTDSEIVEFGIQYLTIVCCCSFGIYAQFVYERILQATGRTFHSMITQLIGAITNIVLDPILIFGLFGMPAMGVRGAAIATVIGQVIAGVTACLMNVYANKDISVNMKGFRPSKSIIVQIYQIGVPSIIMQSIGSIMVFCLNKILIVFSTTATAVFGVYFKLQSFIFMPIFGMNNGMVPIIGFNFGARSKERMMQTYKLALITAICIMSVGVLLFEIFPREIFLLFGASDYMLDMGIPALRIIAIHFPIAAYCIVTGSVFQAVGKAVYSMINSICRQIIVLIPVAFLLSQLGNVNYVWFAFLIAEGVSMVLTAIFFRKVYKEVIITI
ncbi:MAG: MATE family efflux transporter [Agathobacter sp.]|nr:MATE family efflux transporter [Agathobacter sp.]